MNIRADLNKRERSNHTLLTKKYLKTVKVPGEGKSSVYMLSACYLSKR